MTTHVQNINRRESRGRLVGKKHSSKKYNCFTFITRSYRFENNKAVNRIGVVALPMSLKSNLSGRTSQMKALQLVPPMSEREV